MNKLKEVLKDYIGLIFLILSISLVITCLKIYSRYINPVTEFNPPFDYTLEIKEGVLYSTINSKVMMALQSEFNIVNMKIINDTNYELTRSDFTKDNFTDNELYLKDLLLNINKAIYKIWRTNGVTKSISVSLLDYENQEIILLMSENYDIVFSANDKQKIETTRQDWIDLFEHVHDRAPESEKELNEFISLNTEVAYE